MHRQKLPGLLPISRMKEFEMTYFLQCPRTKDTHGPFMSPDAAKSYQKYTLNSHGKFGYKLVKRTDLKT